MILKGKDWLKALYITFRKKKALNDIKKRKTITYHIISHIMSCTSIHYDYNYTYILQVCLNEQVCFKFTLKSGCTFNVSQ